MDRPLSDSERFPLLTEAGRKRLLWLQEHPHAPRFNHRCGDRLDEPALERIRGYGEEFGHAHRGWRWREAPEWLKARVGSVLADVPYYRGYAAGPDFFALPTVRREHLLREPWSFVPDSQPLDELILYRSSHTSGECVTVLSHPEVPARDLPLLEALLATRGIRLEGGSDRVSLVMSCAQTQTITYPAVLSYLGDAGFAKINLNPSDWRDAADRVSFLDDCDPELYSGDPIAFHELMQLPLRSRPKALFSTAMTLLPGFRRTLEAHFGCPVFDLYALNETGIITADGGNGHAVLAHDLYVEILGPDDESCEPGKRGEIVVSGGNNPFLPLLRYRTGDWASMTFDGPIPALQDLEPRGPVAFRKDNGDAVWSHEVTAALGDFPLAAFTLSQAKDGALLFRARGEAVPEDDLRDALASVFGAGCPLQIEELAAPYEWGGKLLEYSAGEATPPAA